MMTDYNIVFFFFNDTATTEIYTLSLHDALPILLEGFQYLKIINLLGWQHNKLAVIIIGATFDPIDLLAYTTGIDRKSTRLNSSHANISYAVFCLKKKSIYLDQIHIFLHVL